MFQPVRLKCRHTSDGKVMFYWGVKSDIGTRQTAFRLTAGTFDSGWVESAQQWTQAALCAQAGETLRWTVTVRDENGQESATAESEFLYGHTAFYGHWLKAPVQKGSVPTCFCKRFSVTEMPLRATLFVTAAGLYTAVLNGEKVGERVLAPDLTSFPKKTFYNVLPLSVHSGENTLLLTLGDGWRRNPGPYGNSIGKGAGIFFGEPCIRAFIRLVFADREELLSTDESWLCGEGPIAYANLFNGEHIDYRRTEDCKTVPAFADDFRLPEPIFDFLPPIKEQETYAPQNIVCMPDGRYVLDFGQNIQGYLRVKISKNIPAGTKITLQHAEELDEDEYLYTATLRGAAATDMVIADGQEHTFSPQFTYHGFRYAQVTGWPGVLEKGDICAVLISTDIRSDSTFTSGSAVLNAIHKAVVMTERDNLIGIATDCPQRDERMGWMNDATVRFTEMPYNFDVSCMLPKIIDDLRDEQDKDGAIACTAPLIFGSRPADPVCSSFLVAGLSTYYATGDTATLRNAYASFKAWNDCLEAHSRDGIVQYSYYGDWAGPVYACEGPEMPRSKTSDSLFVSTAYHYYNATLLQKFAALLGDQAEADRQAQDAARIKKALLQKWYDEKELRIGSNAQAEIAIALWMELLPEAVRPAFAEKLRDSLVACDYHFTTGNLATLYMLQVLSQYGYADEAYRLMTREEYPGYGFMLQHAATTVWERFELKKDASMNSHNHPMYGSVGAWFYSHLAGLRPQSGAWEKFTFAPALPKDLQYVCATVDTVKGDVTARLHRKYGKLYVLLDVPFGCEAQVRLPGVRETAGPGVHRYVLPA